MRRSPSTSTVAGGAAATKPTTARRLAPLSACGVTVVAVNYRLVPRARFPGQLHDLKAAVRWFGQSDLVASGSRTEVEARLLPFTFEAGLLGVADIADAAGCLMFGSAWWLSGVRVSEGYSEATA